jgi:hypothetical protein
MLGTFLMGDGFEHQKRQVEQRLNPIAIQLYRIRKHLYALL